MAEARETDRGVVWGVPVIVLVLLVWLCFPMVTPAHVEGFSASIVSLGTHAAHDQVENFDRLYPFNTEFFWLSRLGMNLAVGGFSLVPGIDASLGARLCLWIGVVALTGGSLYLVTRLAGVNRWWSAATLLLIPAVSESAFFINDNVLSAGLAVSALALVAASERRLTVGVAGVLFGLAVLTRTDAVLLAPAFALVAGISHGWRRQLVSSALIFGTLAFATYASVLAGWGVSPLRVVAVEERAVVLWDRGRAYGREVLAIVYYFGFPALALGMVGVLEIARRREWTRAALLVGVPAIYIWAHAGRLWESRQLLPLTPLLCALVAVGGRSLLQDLGRRGRRWRAVGVGAFVGAALFIPVGVIPSFDGPRSLMGRFWMPLRWREWQRNVQSDFALLHSVVRHGASASRVLVTDEWDADRYLHLVLQKEGYHVAAVPEGLAACERVAEVWAHDSTHVVHVRLHTPMLTTTSVIASILYDELARHCIEIARQGSPMFVGSVAELGALFPDVPHKRARMSAHQARSQSRASALDAVVLTDALLSELGVALRARANRAIQAGVLAGTEGMRPTNPAAAHAALEALGERR